jgi:hypothetical protein
MALLVRQLCRQHSLGERSSEALLTRDALHVRDTYTSPPNAPKPPLSVAKPQPQALLFAS